jgi:hypothetical protein
MQLLALSSTIAPGTGTDARRLMTPPAELRSPCKVRRMP